MEGFDSSILHSRTECGAQICSAGSEAMRKVSQTIVIRLEYSWFKYQKKCCNTYVYWYIFPQNVFGRHAEYLRLLDAANPCRSLDFGLSLPPTHPGFWSINRLFLLGAKRHWFHYVSCSSHSQKCYNLPQPWHITAKKAKRYQVAH